MQARITMIAMIHVITIAPMTPKIKNNKLEFINSLLEGVDGSMLLEVTNVFSMIVRDTDVEVYLILLLAIASNELSVTETTKYAMDLMYTITHNIKYAMYYSCILTRYIS